MKTKKQLGLIYNIKLSGYQINILESALENTLQDNFFDESDELVVKILLDSLKNDIKVEIQ